MSEPWSKSLGAEHRRELLLANRERIEFAYLRARSNGMDDPVILVLDLEDDRAAQLAEWTGLARSQIERWRDAARERDVVATQILAAPRWAVLCVVGGMTPKSPQGIAKPNPPETFRVVAIASGGNSYADFPLPPDSSLVSE